MSRNSQIIEEFRANGGEVGGFFEGLDLLLLHTTGARSGQSRVTPLVYVRYGDSYYVAASKGGAPTHPDWYFNVKADPNVSIEVGADTHDATATIVAAAERAAAYGRLAARYPFFIDYARGTNRIIPVIGLTPKT